MAWQEITLDQPPLLQRAVEILKSCAPLGQLMSVDRILASERSALFSGADRLFYYAGEAFELVTKLTYQSKSDRHQVCYAIAGQVEPQAALDLIVEQTRRYMLDRDIPHIYGCRPKESRSELLGEIYDLAAVDPRIEETLLADRPGMWVYRIAYRQDP